MTALVNDLHIATTRRNIARHSDSKLAAWWERQARYLADRLNTRLVELSDRPGVLVPEIFISLY